MQSLLTHLFLIYLTVDIQQMCPFCTCRLYMNGDLGTELAEAFELRTDSEQTQVERPHLRREALLRGA